MNYGYFIIQQKIPFIFPIPKDLLINKTQPSKKTLISSEQRKAIIDDLLKSHKKFTVRDYLEKVDFQIHPRQAQRD